MVQYFYWCGVAMNVFGAVAVLGALAALAVERWIRFSGSFGPLVAWYVDRARKRPKTYRTGDGY